MPAHVALFGDSILDNAAYTAGQPDVAGHLRALVPADVTVTLLAVDGTTTAELGRQLERLPTGVTHAAVSIGGNDGILELDILDEPVSSAMEAIATISERVTGFEERDRSALEAVAARVPSVAVCTIYNPRLACPERTRRASA